MWQEWLLKALGTAITSTVGMALALWALSFHKPREKRRRKNAVRKERAGDSSVGSRCSKCGIELITAAERCPECGSAP